MKLQQLEYLIGISEAGSLSQAARTLRVAQPALSQQVVNLENELGVRLLIRKRSGIELTRAGHQFCKQARTILNMVEHAREDVTNTSSVVQESVRVYIGPAFTSVVPEPLINAVVEKLPCVRLELVDSGDDYIGGIASDSRIDLALCSPGHLSDTKYRVEDLDSEIIFHDQLHLIGKSGSELASNEPIAFTDAIKLPLVLLPPEIYLRKWLEATALQFGQRLNVFADQPSETIIRSYVDTGLACTILHPHHFYRDLGSDNEQYFIRRIIEPEFTRKIAIFWKKGGVPSASIIAVRSIVRQVIRDLVTGGRLTAELTDQFQHQGDNDRVL